MGPLSSSSTYPFDDPLVPWRSKSQRTLVCVFGDSIAVKYDTDWAVGASEWDKERCTHGAWMLIRGILSFASHMGLPKHQWCQ
jgi:hypothetical protein